MKSSANGQEWVRIRSVLGAGRENTNPFGGRRDDFPERGVLASAYPVWPIDCAILGAPYFLLGSINISIGIHIDLVVFPVGRAFEQIDDEPPNQFQEHREAKKG